MDLPFETFPDSGYEVELIERIPHLNLIHHIEQNGVVWGTHCRKIFRRKNREWELFGRFPFNPPKDFFELSRLTARASRVDQCNLYVNSRGNVLGIRGSQVFRITPSGVFQWLFSIRGDCVLRQGITEDREGWCLFGEYFQNPSRGPVRIFRLSPDLAAWETVYEFHAGSIRHVHAVRQDPFDTSALWVTVGDEDGECFLFRTEDRFRSLERFGDGTQTWRAVGLVFTERHVCWITDSHTRQNVVCRMARNTGRLEIGEEIECSAWYSATTMEGPSVAFTTVEKGPAIQSDRASILISEDGFEWKKAASFRKDFWRPMSVFKYGVLSCPTGRVSLEDFYVSGEGLAKFDGKSLRLRIRRRVADSRE